MEPKKLNLLIGCTGSVATKRLVLIIKALKEFFNIKVMLTKTAKLFSDMIIKDYSLFQKEYDVKIFTEEDGFNEYIENNSTLHIELRKWADAILLAPLSANSLAKITNGICDNLLTSVVRAWDFDKPGFYCLAMNTFMYQHFLTEKQIKILKEDFKFIQIPSVVKKLVCGDIGIGGIADTKDIVTILVNSLIK